MKTCPYCGKKYPDEALVCAIDQEPLDPKLPKTAGLPLEEEARQWIETSFAWLLKEFGADEFLKRPTLLPERAFFPDPYEGTEESVLKVVDRVCGYMGIDPESVTVEFLLDANETAKKHRLGIEESSGAAGLYFSSAASEEKQRIAINVSQFKHPSNLVATIAHELGHVLLLGGGRISREDQRHELLTDLCTVFFGLGIFTANGAFQFSQWGGGGRHGWRAARMGYLSEGMFAYSLAAYAWMRGESKPAWSRCLAMNVGCYFKECLKYLEDGNSTALVKLAGPDSKPPSTASAVRSRQ